MHKRILLFFCFFTYCIALGQMDSSWKSKKNKITIPFEFSSNLIQINILVNNVRLKVILDTGSTNNILFSFNLNDSIKLNNQVKTKVYGIGIGNTIEAFMSKNNNLKIKEYETNDFSILTISKNNIGFLTKLGKEINGVIGFSFFKDRLIEIDYEKNELIIHKNRQYLKRQKIKKFTKQKIKIINNKPYLTINSTIDEATLQLNLLLDTGMSDGLWLFKNDTLRGSKVFINDYLGFGLAGEIFGKRSRIKNVKLSNFQFNDVLVAYPDSLSFKNINITDNRNGSLGSEIIKRFHVLIDYKNETLYLKKNKYFNDPFNFNMSGLDIKHSGIEYVKEEITLNSSIVYTNILNNYISNISHHYKFSFKPVFIISNVKENSNAHKEGVLPEDKIISINDQKANNFTLQQIIELFQSKEGRKIKLELERNEQIIIVEFFLQKII